MAVSERSFTALRLPHVPAPVKPQVAPTKRAITKLHREGRPDSHAAHPLWPCTDAVLALSCPCLPPGTGRWAARLTPARTPQPTMALAACCETCGTRQDSAGRRARAFSRGHVAPIVPRGDARGSAHAGGSPLPGRVGGRRGGHSATTRGGHHGSVRKGSEPPAPRGHPWSAAPHSPRHRRRRRRHRPGSAAPPPGSGGGPGLTRPARGSSPGSETRALAGRGWRGKGLWLCPGSQGAALRGRPGSSPVATQAD